MRKAATEPYAKAVAIRADLAESWSNLGVMGYQSQQYPQAEQAFRLALKISKALFVPNLISGSRLTGNYQLARLLKALETRRLPLRRVRSQTRSVGDGHLDPTDLRAA